MANKCENCIHDGVCWYQDMYGYSEDNCNMFKDKSLFVELPCAIGDEIWYCNLGLNEVCPAKIIKIELNYYTPHNLFWIMIEYKSILIGKHESVLHEPEFKELCFKSKEAAENKLKEYEEK